MACALYIHVPYGGVETLVFSDKSTGDHTMLKPWLPLESWFTPLFGCSVALVGYQLAAVLRVGEPYDRTPNP